MDYEVEDVIRRVLRHHGVPVSRKLVRDLCSVGEWTQKKTLVHGRAAQLDASLTPLVVLSGLGIYGAEATNKVEVQ